ncbi:Leucine-rich repeat-containing protein 7 [Varanus komodoensis]|nr:Leucine-rich repeat-containing protein 7 [Varanus komodoensis]
MAGGIQDFPENIKCCKCLTIIEASVNPISNQPCPNPPDSALVYPKTPQFLHEDIMGHFVKGLAEIQCKEIEEKNRIERTRDLFKKIGDMKGTFHAKMGIIKDQNGRDLKEAEEIKKRWQDYTEELYKKELNVPDNHDGVVTDLEPDILVCEVKSALGSLSNNKASGESEEELKNLLMQVKEESTKVGLKLNIKKTKIMASGPLTSWQIDGEEMEVVTDFIFQGSMITADSDCGQEIKRRLLLGRKAMANIDSILKSRDITCRQKLPDGFTQLLNLTQLYLNDAFLEFLPANFGRLVKLRILELRENHLKTLPNGPTPYWVDLDESEVDSTSPDAVVTSQGPASPEELHIMFIKLMSRLVKSSEIETIDFIGARLDSTVTTAFLPRNRNHAIA